MHPVSAGFEFQAGIHALAGYADHHFFVAPVFSLAFTDQLRGLVEARDGSVLEGRVRWDNDEEFTWEILDGDSRGVEFDIEFSNIARVEKISDSSTQVILRDGRSFDLTGSNDVNNGNKGIFVTTEAGEILAVEWFDLEGVSFRDWRSDQARSLTR